MWLNYSQNETPDNILARSKGRLRRIESRHAVRRARCDQPASSASGDRREPQAGLSVCRRFNWPRCRLRLEWVYGSSKMSPDHSSAGIFGLSGGFPAVWLRSERNPIMKTARRCHAPALRSWASSRARRDQPQHVRHAGGTPPQYRQNWLTTGWRSAPFQRRIVLARASLRGIKGISGRLTMRTNGGLLLPPHDPCAAMNPTIGNYCFPRTPAR